MRQKQHRFVCYHVRTRKRPGDCLGIQAIDFGFQPTSKDRIVPSFGRGFDSHRPLQKPNHPNICVLYDVGSQDGMDYLVMECVEGETLAKRLERGGYPRSRC